MIVHSITPYVETERRVRHQQPPSKHFKGELGSIEHKKAIFERALGATKISVQDMLTTRKGRELVQVLDIYAEFDMVQWEGLKPLFIECWTPNDQKNVYLLHPSDFRKKR